MSAIIIAEREREHGRGESNDPPEASPSLRLPTFANNGPRSSIFGHLGYFCDASPSGQRSATLAIRRVLRDAGRREAARTRRPLGAEPRGSITYARCILERRILKFVEAAFTNLRSEALKARPAAIGTRGRRCLIKASSRPTGIFHLHSRSKDTFCCVTGWLARARALACD